MTALWLRLGCLGCRRRSRGVRPLTINLLWVIGVLIMIVAAFAVVAPSGDVLQGYISFASAIASILLALVAIFYAFVSNQSVSNTLSELRGAATALSNETSRLRTASSGLSDEADQILRRLSSVPTALSEMSGELNRKIEDLAGQQTFRTTQANDPVPPNTFDPGGKPVSLVVSLYIIYLAYQNKNYINIDEIFKEPEYKFMADYLSGFLEAMKYFNKYGVDVEGFAKQFAINNIGDLDLTALAERLRAADKNSESINKLVQKIDSHLSENKASKKSIKVPENLTED